MASMSGTSVKHIKVSAPGKIILHGEHAVVYQKAAIAVSLGMRSRLDLKETTSGVLSISMERFLDKTSWNVDDFRELIAGGSLEKDASDTTIDETLYENIRRFVRSRNSSLQNGDGQVEIHNSKQEDAVLSFLYVVVKLCKLTGRDIAPSVTLVITSDIPVSAGLGSSAAFAVCITASLLSYFGVIACGSNDIAGKLIPQPHQLAQINHWAFLIEKIIHGTASGIDNTISTYGGVIKYCNQEMTNIPCRLKLEVVVVDTRVQKDTKRMVELVKRRKKDYPSVVDPILESIDGISKIAFEILNCGKGLPPTTEEYEIFSDLITINHNLLCALGVSHPALDAACAASSKWGQAAKLTGAGGGGCAIVVLDPDILNFQHLRDSLLADFRKMEFRPHVAEIGEPGVFFHPLT